MPTVSVVGATFLFSPLYGLTAQEKAENDRFAPETVAGALMAMVSSCHAPAYIADIGREDLRRPSRR
jgi:hypothetical protein